MAAPAQPPKHNPRRNRPPVDPVSLAEHLGACYAARHGFGPATAHDDFCKALQGNRALMGQAQERFQELEALHAHCNGDIGKRCALSAAHYDTLKSALGK